MATTFKNASATLTTSLATVYTVPSATTAIVIAAHASNKSASAVTFTMNWHDSSDSNATRNLANGTSIPTTSSYEPVSKIVLEAGDYIQASAGANTAVDFSISILEIT